jgi:hypothetical protein
MPQILVCCEECKLTSKRWPSQLATRKYGSFCDRKCLGKFRTRVLTSEKAANFKTGSRYCHAYLEVEAKWHPRANKKGYVSLHRLIAEAYAGAFLAPNEIVHHKDGDQRNNHWDNLEILTQAEHARMHTKERKRDKNGRF